MTFGDPSAGDFAVFVGTNRQVTIVGTILIVPTMKTITKPVAFPRSLTLTSTATGSLAAMRFGRVRLRLGRQERLVWG